MGPSTVPRRPATGCPHCGRYSARYLRFAFSSWLLPVSCAACGARFYLGYHPVVFVLLWMVLSPLYLIALLYLALFALPIRLVVPAFLVATFASGLLLPLIGGPRLKSPPSA